MPDSFAWRNRPDLPAQITAESTDFAKSLFKAAPRSIYPVVVGESSMPRAPQAVSGSAVAISETVLLTTCGVVETGGRDLLVGVDGPDTLVRADIVARSNLMNRCVVSVSGVHLHPVAGVRRFDTLEIGETVYVVGDTAERSLSEGRLSGVRVVSGARFLQTTAAISSGSLGRGLFDVRGNLLGITAAIPGDSGGSEVAIPAEDYWK
jgi:S1-C subfamily serine protease